MPGSFLIGRVADGADVPVQVDETGSLKIAAGLEIPSHDYIGMTYTGSNLTGVTYKIGGVGGTAVATLTLSYDGNSNLTSVTRS